MLPDIVTMNHAHSTHYTDRPDPDIKFVLRGWRDDGKPAGHDVSFGDVRVRSVSTNIRNWNGGTEFNGNSIFIFEMGNLCIAHLGHLHHTLTQQQLDEMGRIDVLLVPVDGAFTMDMDGMVEVVRSIKAPLMVPMHFFSTFTLRRFLERVSRRYDIDYAEVPYLRRVEGDAADEAEIPGAAGPLRRGRAAPGEDEPMLPMPIVDLLKDAAASLRRAASA